MIDLNFNEKLQKVKNSIIHWKKRILTPIGKIAVIKSILLPLFTHCFTSLPTPNTVFLKTLNDLFYDFIWEGKAKIKQSVLIKTYIEGGLNMVDIYSYIHSLKIKWFKRYVSNSKSKCYKLVNTLFDIDKIFNTGKMFCNLIISKITNSFWIDVLKAYMVFVDKLCIDNIEQVLHMPLFYNHNFLAGNRYIYIQTLYNKGIRFVKDIINEQGNFVDLIYLEQVTGKPVNFLQYHSLKQAIKMYMQKLNICISNNLLNVQYPIINCYVKPILTMNNNKKYVYEIIAKNSDIPTSQERWNTCFKDNNINWQLIYSYVFKCSKDSYIQWFQTRIIHRTLATNSLLFKMKIVDNKMCTFCKCCEETLLHLFWECQKIQSLFQYLRENLHNFDDVLCCKSFILGTETKDFKYDILFLELKRYIYLSKRKNFLPTCIGFKNSLKLAWNIYRNTHLTDDENNRWSIIRSLIAS